MLECIIGLVIMLLVVVVIYIIASPIEDENTECRAANHPNDYSCGGKT